MQWLIDLVIEAIGVPPTFIDRGDPVAADLTRLSFIGEAEWLELDLSSVVPAGAQAVALAVKVLSPATGALMIFRRYGNTYSVNTARAYIPVAAVVHWFDLIVAVDSNRKIEYFPSNDVWNELRVTVKGWWL